MVAHAPVRAEGEDRFGAPAVQIVEKKHGRRRVVEHPGPTRTEAGPAALMPVGREEPAVRDQPDLGSDDRLDDRSRSRGGAAVQGQASRLFVETIREAWDRLGSRAVEDEAFFQLVPARPVEPAPNSDGLRAIDGRGLPAPHRNAFTRALRRCAGDDHRSTITGVCSQHARHERGGDVSLLLHDMTTSCFEAEKEDSPRKTGYSKVE